MEVKVVETIRVTFTRGKGTTDDVIRSVTAYFLMDGTLLVEHDPCPPSPYVAKRNDEPYVI